MSHRGHLDGLSAQAPGLMRHGSFAAGSLPSRSPLNSSSTLEMLENKLAMQTAEVEKLIRENQRLATSHVVLRQDIVDTEKEMQLIRKHLGEVQTETDLQIRDLLERIRLMEADIQSGDTVKKELHQVHMEAKRLIGERQILTLEIENATKEIQKLSASGDNKSLPELLAELDGLRKEHHSLRSQFEFEKNTNVKQVEQMRTMEVNLITMTKQAEKLRADVANAERRAQAAAAQAAAQAAGAQVAASQPGTAQATAVSAAATNPYASAYANYPTAYHQGTQPGDYQQGAQPGAYQQGAQPGAYQQGAQPGAYQQGAQPGAYQQGAQPAAYQQGTQAGAYTYAYDAAAYQMHAAQANAYAGYSGYPVAGYAQSAVPNYPAAYAVPPQPASSGAATDAANMYGAVGSTGYPAGQVQPSCGTANAAQAPPPPPPPTAPYPGTYDPTRGAQR
ncbi:Protein FLX-like 4 [Dichanthelium oligosanthes]|uniref:Protein FLX-like 4 n=1 Tax=Dichanthelium oligosanthes TaxID=888268 RepID=A0A1E5VQ64_9POAL|nr:Protein FLX-like 4 [Dichanthelium oligosanthes]